MSNVKFIVPEGQSKAGNIVEVTESDAKDFDALGWERVEKKENTAKSDKKK